MSCEAVNFVGHNSLTEYESVLHMQVIEAPILAVIILSVLVDLESYNL